MARGIQPPTACPLYPDCTHVVCRYCTVGHGDVHVDPLSRECSACTTYFTPTSTLELFLSRNSYILQYDWDKNPEVYKPNPRRLRNYLRDYCGEEMEELSLRKQFDELFGPYYTEDNQ